MTVLVTYQWTGVDGKACMAGKESNTKSLTRSIRMTEGIMMMATMRKVLIVMALMIKVSLTRFRKSWNFAVSRGNTPRYCDTGCIFHENILQ